MKGYYQDADKRAQGPMDWDAMEALAEQRLIHPHTLVVVDQFPGWRTWHEVCGLRGQVARAVDLDRRCVACGQDVDDARLAWLGPHPVCTECRGWVVDRVREGRPVRVATEVRRADPGSRLAARFVDGLVIGFVQILLAGVLVPVGFLVPLLKDSLGLLVVWMGLVAPAGIIYFLGIPVVFEAWCLHRWGATPGKLATGLRVAADDTSEGLSWGRALGRTVSVWCSAMPMGMGFLRVAWDPSGQMLHDLICNTRVFRKAVQV